MSNEITWTTRLCVDGSVDYRAEPPALMCNYDIWAVEESGIPELPRQARVDVIVSSQREAQAAWLVEVKDYRRLTRFSSNKKLAQKMRERLGGLSAPLESKLSSTLDFIASAECPPSLVRAVQGAGDTCFVFHCIIPDNAQSLSPMIPTGFPVNQFIAFKHSRAAEKVGRSILRKNDAINDDPSLPWRVTLRPVEDVPRG